jgi:hypothetical protein
MHSKLKKRMRANLGFDQRSIISWQITKKKNNSSKSKDFIGDLKYPEAPRSQTP